MSFIDIDTNTLTGPPTSFKERPKEDATFMDLFGAAVVDETTVGNTVAMILEGIDERDRLQGVEDDPNYDAINDPQAAGYENYIDEYMHSRSREQTAIAIQRINDTLARKRSLYENGWSGYGAMFAAGLLDPINLIPFGAGSKAVKGGSVLREVGQFAGYGAATAAIDEAFAKAHQGSLRPVSESLMNLAADTVFMGALGGGTHYLGKYLASGGAEELGDALKSQLRGAIDPSGAHASLSAAKATRADLANMRSKWSVLGSWGQKNWLTGTPLGRSTTSSSEELSRIALSMGEDAERRVGETFGVKAQQSIETMIETKWKTKLRDAVRALDDFYLEYRGAADNLSKRISVNAADTRAAITGVKADAQMTYIEFKKAVSLAMMNGDASPVPAVAAAAKKFREDVFDPLKKAAIDVGLLPEDVKTLVSDSYLTRVWDVEKVVRNRDRFTQILRDYFMDEAKIEQARDPAEVARWKARLESATTEEARVQEVLRQKVEAKNVARKLVQKHRRGLPNRIGYEAALKRQLERDNREVAAARARERHFSTDKKLQADDPLVEEIALARELAHGRLKEPPRITDRIRDLGGIKDMNGTLSRAGLKSIKYRHGVIAASGEGKTPKEMLDLLNRERWPLGQWSDDVGMTTGVEVEDLMRLIKTDTDAKGSLSKTPVYNEALHGDEIAKYQTARAMLDDIEASGANVSMPDAQIAYKIGAVDEFVAGDTPVTRERHRGSVWYLNRSVKRAEQSQRSLDEVSRGLDGRSTKIKDALAQRDALDGEVKSLFRERTAYRNVIRHDTSALNYHEKMRGISESDYFAIISDVINNITGNNGRGMYQPIPLVGRSLKELVLKIGHDKVLDFLDLDIANIAKSYTRQMAADVELSRAHGSPDMADAIDSIKYDYAGLHDEVGESLRARYSDEHGNLANGMTEEKLQAKIGQRHAALHKEQEQGIRDIELMRDRLRGSSGLPSNPSGFLHRASVAARSYNTLRLGGGFMLASLPDVGSIILSHGLAPVIGKRGLAGIIAKAKGATAARDEANWLGTGMDLVLDQHGHRFTDIADEFGQNTAFERGLRWAADKYGIVNGLSIWTNAMKQWAGATSHSWLTETIEATVKGTVKRRDYERLLWLGIDEHDAARIYKQMERHGKKVDGQWEMGVRNWTKDPRPIESADMAGNGELRTVKRDGVESYEVVEADDELRDMVGAALVKDTNTAIVTPGVGDKPAWLDSEVGKVIGQFRSFFLSSMTRITRRALQTRDANVLKGLVTMTTLGALAYYLKTPSEKLSDDPMVWLKEGVDRSGAAGWLFEANNMTEKITGNQIGLSPLLGQKAAQRYASRGVLANILGPTAGLADTAIGLSAASASGELTEGDWNNLSRSVPMWNTFYLKWLRKPFEDDKDDPSQGHRQ